MARLALKSGGGSGWSGIGAFGEAEAGEVETFAGAVRAQHVTRSANAKKNT